LERAANSSNWTGNCEEVWKEHRTAATGQGILRKFGKSREQQQVDRELRGSSERAANSSNWTGNCEEVWKEQRTAATGQGIVRKFGKSIEQQQLDREL
jgi:hypothetical protein